MGRRKKLKTIFADPSIIEIPSNKMKKWQKICLRISEIIELDGLLKQNLRSKRKNLKKVIDFRARNRLKLITYFQELLDKGFTVYHIAKWVGPKWENRLYRLKREISSPLPIIKEDES